MLAGLVTARHRFDLVEMPDPVAAPGLCVVEVERCGICGTDVHGFQSDAAYNPAICGHEFAGTIRSVGQGVTRVREGDRVVAGIAAPCGLCRACTSGRTAWCEPAFLGMIGRDRLAPIHGAFASHVAIAANRLIGLSAPLSVEEAAIIEPATVAFHGIGRTRIRPGDSVTVIGAGPIGLLAMQCARLAGSGRVVVSEPNAARRNLAAELGATVAVAPDELADIQPEADVVIECAGIPTTVQVAVDRVRRGGTVSLLGVTDQSAQIQPGVWLRKEIRVVASLGYEHHEFSQVIDLVADRRIQLLPLHSETIPLARAAEAFARLAADPSSAIKVLVDPTAR